MPSFDVISKIDQAELDNAVNQTKKELSTRYDFQGAHADIVISPDRAMATVKAHSEEKVQAAKEVLLSKLAKRGISLRALEFLDIEKTGLSNVKQNIKLQQGIPVEKSKELVKLLKDAKLKGLPQSNCYVNVLRSAMAVDSLDSCGIYFGTTGGQVYASADSGDSWSAIVRDLPAVMSVEVQVLP
jgi:uncharacterized protein YajQ (UPF0234 family)